MKAIKTNLEKINPSMFIKMNLENLRKVKSKPLNLSLKNQT